jgi:hypothetical protein
VSHAYTTKVTLIEIYNEALRDLLEPRDESGKDKVSLSLYLCYRCTLSLTLYVCLSVCLSVCIISVHLVLDALFFYHNNCLLSL